jgi:hypothetical protein
MRDIRHSTRTLLNRARIDHRVMLALRHPAAHRRESVATFAAKTAYCFCSNTGTRNRIGFADPAEPGLEIFDPTLNTDMIV